jgi:hypothetical protein
MLRLLGSFRLKGQYLADANQFLYLNRGVLITSQLNALDQV